MDLTQDSKDPFDTCGQFSCTRWCYIEPNIWPLGSSPFRPCVQHVIQPTHDRRIWWRHGRTIDEKIRRQSCALVFLSRLILSEAILRRLSLAVWPPFTLQHPLYCLTLKSWLIRPRIIEHLLISFPYINLRAWKWRRSQAQVQMRFGPILTVCCETHFPAWKKDSKKHRRIKEEKPSGIRLRLNFAQTLVLNMINMLAKYTKGRPFLCISNCMAHCRKPETV